MKKPSEKQIELFANNPESFSVEQREWIKTWLEKDEELAMLASWYREYYQQVDAIERVRKKENTTVPSVIELKAFKNGNRVKNNFVLAAQTSTASKTSFHSFRSFASGDERTLLRVMYNREKQSTRLQIISDFLDEDDIVMIENSDSKKLLISRPGGSLELPESELSKEDITGWRGCNIHLPFLKILLYRDNEMGNINYSLSQKGSEAVDVEIDDSEIRIGFSAEMKGKIPGKMILHTRNVSTYQPVHNSICTIPLEDVTGTLSQVAFYR